MTRFTLENMSGKILSLASKKAGILSYLCDLWYVIIWYRNGFAINSDVKSILCNLLTKENLLPIRSYFQCTFGLTVKVCCRIIVYDDIETTGRVTIMNEIVRATRQMIIVEPIKRCIMYFSSYITSFIL